MSLSIRKKDRLKQNQSTHEVRQAVSFHFGRASASRRSTERKATIARSFKLQAVTSAYALLSFLSSSFLSHLISPLLALAIL